MAAIFDNIVTKENGHTNLLRSIMERHQKPNMRKNEIARDNFVRG
ncbi:MAG: hypothetical protein WCF30_00070 [Terracidiphilus sp.]